MNPEALILRRCYPVPVTFADLRAAALDCGAPPWFLGQRKRRRASIVKDVMMWWHAALKQVTSAIDEVYAVVDGREVRVAVVDKTLTGWLLHGELMSRSRALHDLMVRADEQGYWERPHEVRLDLSPRPVTHDEVARAVLVGQEALERGGVVRP